jgi:hypothetical protein
VWADSIIEYLHRGAFEKIKVSNVLEFGLNVPKERHDKRLQMRVAAVLRQLGWKRSIEWDGKTARLWEKPKT